MKNSLNERTRIQHGVIKEEYRTLQMEIIAFETEDIITAKRIGRKGNFEYSQ